VYRVVFEHTLRQTLKTAAQLNDVHEVYIHLEEKNNHLKGKVK